MHYFYEKNENKDPVLKTKLICISTPPIKIENRRTHQPLVFTPIQFRYLVNFLDMNVLPRAGSPTITKHVGTLAVKENQKKRSLD